MDVQMNVDISVYGSHNGGVVLWFCDKVVDGCNFVIIEAERFLNAKNMGLAQYLTPIYPTIVFEQIMAYIARRYGVITFRNCYYSSSDFVGEDWAPPGGGLIYKHFWLHKLVDAENYYHCQHHEAHANGVFYQSPYNEALIFSFDGGGDDGEFNIYHGERESGVVRLAQLINPTLNNPHVYYNLGFAYMIFGDYLNAISQEPISTGNLVWPGKLMGLCAYGTVNEDWLPHFIEFFKSDPDGDKADYIPKINKLGEAINVVFDPSNRLLGTESYDVAATAQRAFEECFLEVANEWFEKYPDLPVCITGGCALNIILNTRVRDMGKEVFVGPNPNDCGIAAGMMLKYIKPKRPMDLTYAGIEPLDQNTLAEIILHHNGVKKIMCEENLEYHPHEQCHKSVISKDLADGKIIGVIRGRSEHGPRALGNRSILCNPMIKGMKDTLNEKVKHREWYRPFAPVVRAEDVAIYFEFYGESRWMSFCPRVRAEYREILSEITHVDGTARVQTVKREDNPWLYNLLTEFEALTGVGVLLNTSFNINGKPIASTYRDAFELYKTSEMDGLVFDDYYCKKTWKQNQ